MARIRTIKPEFVQSESTGRLSRDARLLFIQLWTIADDEGRARAHSRMLASLLYPYDEDAPNLIEGWLAELEREGCIHLYEAEGNTYLEVSNWQKHQKIDRPSKSRLPVPPNTREPSTKPREDSRSLDADLGPRTLDLDQDSRVASGPTVEESFDRFRSAYPKREGGDPKKPAFEKFRSAVNGGVDPNVIIAAAANFADECERKRTEPRYIPMAKAWLHQARWESYSEAAAEKTRAITSFDKLVKVFEGTPQWKAWAQYWRATHGVTLTEMDIQDDSGRHRPGRHLDSEWPPGHDPTLQKQAA